MSDMEFENPILDDPDTKAAFVCHCQDYKAANDIYPGHFDYEGKEFSEEDIWDAVREIFDAEPGTEYEYEVTEHITYTIRARSAADAEEALCQSEDPAKDYGGTLSEREIERGKTLTPKVKPSQEPCEPSIG